MEKYENLNYTVTFRAMISAFHSSPTPDGKPGGPKSPYVKKHAAYMHSCNTNERHAAEIKKKEKI